jgi:CheY-like chemotaxis protein
LPVSSVHARDSTTGSPRRRVGAALVEIDGLSCQDSDVRGALVLVVDDHPGFRRLARRVLERAGFQVAEATDGAEAVAQAKRLRPDVVLLDVQLPDIDGFAVAESLAEAEHSPPVVLTSTREAADYGERVGRSSAVGFLPKAALSGPALKALLGRR